MHTSIKSLMLTTSFAVLLGSSLAGASEVDRLNGETFAREFARQVEQQERTRTAGAESGQSYEMQAREQVRQREQARQRGGMGAEAAGGGRDMSSSRPSQGAGMSRLGSRPTGARSQGGFSRSGMR
ncbi:MAG TPA: hypothetical protein ENJ80_15245 [Gammaproteobacteria bacterium]|nr:hypothetical protein [Gammaproteobacteria bacterium]